VKEKGRGGPLAKINGMANFGKGWSWGLGLGV